MLTSQLLSDDTPWMLDSNKMVFLNDRPSSFTPLIEIQRCRGFKSGISIKIGMPDLNRMTKARYVYWVERNLETRNKDKDMAEQFDAGKP